MKSAYAAGHSGNAPNARRAFRPLLRRCWTPVLAKAQAPIPFRTRSSKPARLGQRRPMPWSCRAGCSTSSASSNECDRAPLQFEPGTPNPVRRPSGEAEAGLLRLGVVGAQAAEDECQQSLDARFSEGKAFVAMADVLDYAFQKCHRTGCGSAQGIR